MNQPLSDARNQQEKYLVELLKINQSIRESMDELKEGVKENIEEKQRRMHLITRF